MQVWRLCQAEFHRSAWTGQGAALAGGRWNPVGIPVVYASSSIAQASMELYVHIDPQQPPPDLVLVSALISPQVFIPTIALDLLPSNWRALDNAFCQNLGARWIKSAESVAMRVPSAAVDGEWNILLDPRHPDFQKITQSPPEPWAYDSRLFRPSL